MNNVKRYLSKYNWLVILTLLVSYIAVKWWRSFIVHGYVYDGRQGFTLDGVNATGHLVGISLAVVCLFYFLFKSIIMVFKNNA